MRIIDKRVEGVMHFEQMAPGEFFVYNLRLHMKIDDCTADETEANTILCNDGSCCWFADGDDVTPVDVNLDITA